jgi:hypothetical protein
MRRHIGRWQGWATRLLPALAVALAVAPGPGARAADGKIAFAVDISPEGRASRIYVANPDGSGARALSNGAGRDRAPAFSPDGRSLAYQSTNELGLDTLVVQPVDGGHPGRALAAGTNPQWSRDGKRLLFSRRQLNEYSLYVIKADGTQKDGGLKPLAKGQIGRWSPDEHQLAVVAPVILDGKDRWQIQVMPVDNSQPHVRLTLPETYGQVVSLEWSPNGESLLFSVVRQSQYDLYVMDLKSPDPRRVPAGNAVPNAAYGAWSPTGKEILFRAAVGGDGPGMLSRLCVMKADGTGVRTIWEPEDKSLRLHGTAWYRPPTAVAAVTDPKLPNPVKPEPPQPVKPAPGAPGKTLGPPRLLHAEKLFTVQQPRSPVSVSLAIPGGADFVVSVPVNPTKDWKPRRQGVGVTLELEDGSLYRGTVIYSGVPWATLQGRPKGAKVRLIDGKKLAPEAVSFGKGFKLTVRREGNNVIVAVDDKDVLTRSVLSAPVKTLALTLENFDPGDARFNLGAIYYREWGTETAPPK